MDIRTPPPAPRFVTPLRGDTAAVRHTALLTWDLPPAPTGLGRAADEIARGLGENGVEVTVISLDRDEDSFTPYGRIVGARRFLGTGLRWLRHRAVAGHLAAPLAFRRALAATGARFDLVEATNWYAPGALVPRKSPLVVRHSTPASKTFSTSETRRDRIDLRAAHGLEARTARRAAAQIFNTDHHREAMLVAYGLRPDPVTQSVIGLALSDEVIRRGAAAPVPANDGFDLLFVGRAEPRKGFDEALRAVVQVAASSGDPSVRLHIVGMDRTEVQDRAGQLGIADEADRVVVAYGRAADSELHRLLGRVDAVLAPSRYESYGLVYREAAAFGRPVIACAEDPSACAFAKESGAAILAVDCTPNAIAREIRSLRSDDNLRARLRLAGHEHARTLTRRALGAATKSAYEAALAPAADRSSNQPVSSPS